mgnify:CR=1 FL=1
MNWLDWFLLAVLAVSALMGMRIGLLGAAFAVVGVIIGWLLAGQYSDDVGALFGDNLTGDTWVTIVSYTVIIVGTVIVANITLKFLRPLLTIVTLGLSSLVDRLGGLAIGAVIGLALIGPLIIGLARLTYNFDTEALTTQLAERVPSQVSLPTKRLDQVDDVREKLEESLINSQIVSAFVDVTDSLPGEALGMVPGDFGLALDILAENLQ